MAGAPPEPPANAGRGEALSRRQRLALGGAFFVGVALLVPGLFAPLWIDDVLRTFSTSVDAARWWTWLIEDVHNPLYNVFMRGWIHLFGDSLVSIRVPTALAALLVALSGSLWAAHRFGAWAGVCLAMLLLCNPALILHATMAKNNLFTVLFATLALICYDMGRHAQRAGGIAARRWFVSAVVAGVLGLYTDWGVLYILLPMWLVMGTMDARRRDWRALRTLLLAVTIVVAATVPLILLKVSHAGELERAYLRHFSLLELWHLLCNWMLWGNALLPAPEDRTLIAALGTLIAGPLLIRGIIELWQSGSGRLLLGVLFLAIGATLLASAILHARNPDGGSFIYQERNLLVLLPIYLLILIVGGLAMRPRWLGRGLLGLLIGLNLLGAILQWTVHAEAATSYWPRRDFGAMAREIESRVERMEPPVLLVSVPPIAPTRYHLSYREDIVYWRRWRRYPTRFVDVRAAANEAGVGELLLLVIRDEADFSVRLEIIRKRWATEHLAYLGGLDLYVIRRPENQPVGAKDPGDRPGAGESADDEGGGDP